MWAVGQVLCGRYRVQRCLGQGGLATTYAAMDLLEAEPVALKILSADPALAEVLRAEFELLSGRVHPHLCRVRNFGYLQQEHQAVPFYAADLVDGEPLELFASHSAPSAVRAALCDALMALAWLHAQGIRHGDFKPQNVLVDSRGRGVLIDLSCAERWGRAVEVVRGTPNYLAPEICPGERIDARADLYGVGVTLEVLRHAFSSDSDRSLCKRCCAVSPAARPADIEEVIEALGGTPAARRRFLPSVGLLGRKAILEPFEARLAALEAEPSSPGSRVLWLRGSAGSGKTRALRALTWRAQPRCEVVEGRAQHHGTVLDWLGRATGTALPLGANGVVQAYERLASRSALLVLVLDDVNRLAPAERHLFDSFLRLLRGNEPLLILCSDTRSAFLHTPIVAELELAPLCVGDVEQWAGNLLGLQQARTLCERTAGTAALIEMALVRLCAGHRFADVIADIETVALNVSALSSPERSALAALAVCGGALDRECRVALEVDDGALAKLVEAGLARHEGTQLRLACADSRANILQTVDAAIVRSLQDRYVQWLETQTGAEWTAARIGLRLDRGDVEGAERDWLAAEALARNSPWAFRGLARRWVELSGSSHATVCAIRTLLEAGDTEEALALAGMLVDQSPPLSDGVASDAALVCAECELRLGRADRVAARLARVDRRIHFVQAAYLEARLHLARGAFREGAGISEEGLAAAKSPEDRARLMETAGLCAGYLGDVARAREGLLDAANQFQRWGDVRGQVRAGLSLAIVAFRSGQVHEAIEHNQHFLAIAERHGLDDQVATAWVNLGTSLQKTSDWGGALGAYDRALRLAAALGKRNSEATLCFNLANLYVEIGLFERAEASEQRARGLADELGLGHIEAPLLRLRAERLLWQGQVNLEVVPDDRGGVKSSFKEVRAQFAQARSAFERSGATRDVLDCDLWLAETARLDGDAAAVAEWLDRLDISDGLAENAELKVRHLLLSARLAMDGGRARAVLGSLNRAQVLAQQTNKLELMADIDLALADAYERSEQRELVAEQIGRARRTWQRIGASLPEAFRTAFELHPRRQRVFAGPAVSLASADAAAMLQSDPRGLASGDLPAATQERPAEMLQGHGPALRASPGLSPERLERFFAVNRAINSSLSMDRVLENAMDAAIELTAAERGFVLLAGKGVSVAAARNLDRERIGRSHAKFSRSIAERVIATDEPLVTIDAQSDERFREQRSVHAMRLKSVVCVPIRAPSGVLGALYLDNRFEPGRFGAQDVRLLLAFADQVAMALENARLHAELAARTEELEEAHATIARQLEGQAQQIENLTKEVEARQRTLEYRFDYSQIVGQSAPMRAVFAQLERVIDSNLPVVLQGESGTGKELCARAIHYNSPRKKARMVSLNCAALPQTLLESELFGYRRGAFTGADRDHTGLLAQAAGGTVFLDEVGEMPLVMQAKLLRVLEEKEVRPLGSDAVVAIDVRFLCATNRNLVEEVEQGRFRQDLYYRLGVVVMTLPPLRERWEDIPLLAESLLRAHHAGMRISPSALKLLTAHRWPGNVRELANVLARAAVMAKDGLIQPSDLQILESPATARLPETRKDFDREEARRIRAALIATRWNISLVSRQLAIPRQTLYRKLERYRIRRTS